MSEQDLITACLNNDRTAQRRLYEQYAGRMLVVCNRYAQTSAEAEDMLQEGFIKVFEKLHTLKGQGSLGPWVKRIMINTALNTLRSRPEAENIGGLQYLDNEVTETQPDISHLHFQELIALVRQLPQGCQTVFNLYAIEGYQHNEIAEMLGISQGTSKSQYARAKSLMQEKIQKLEAINNSNALKKTP